MLITNPILVLSLMMLIILLFPLVFGKLRIPGIIGLIIAGIIIGPYGLKLIDNNSSIDLFSTIGMLYIMFLAGLDIDMNQFKIVKNKTIVFSALTFIIPIMIGFPVCFHILKLSLPASIIIASMFASHTLVAYPIVSNFGITKNQAVAITVGGTVVADTLVLVIVAFVLKGHEGALDLYFYIKIAVSLAIFSIIMFWLIPRMTRWFFKKVESEKYSHFIFVLSVMFFASFLADISGLESIIGAFIAGLVLNRLIPHSSSLMNRLEFFGNAFFIPFFLISVGMILDLGVLLKGPRPIYVAVVLSAAAFIGKWIPAYITQKLFRFSILQRRLIFGLSSSHAAATLAIILSGYKIGMLDDNILNGTVILILITCMVSSFIVEKTAKQMVLNENTDEYEVECVSFSEKILLPVANISNIPKFLDFAILLKDPDSSLPITILSVVPDNEHVETNIIKANNKLEQFIQQGSSAEVNVQVSTTIDQNVFGGISRTAREILADIVILGWPDKISGVIDRILGAHFMQLINNIDKTVFVCSINKPLIDVRRIFLMTTPYAELENGFEQWLIKVIQVSKELNSPIAHFGSARTRKAIENLVTKGHLFSDIQYSLFENWESFQTLSLQINKTDLIVLVCSRQGFPSYSKRFEQLTDILTFQLMDNDKIAIYPQQTHPFSTII